MIQKFLAILALSLIFISPAYAVDDDDAHTIFYTTSLTGGGSGSLDGAVSGVSIGQFDSAIVTESGTSRVFIYRVSLSSEAENSPFVIRPDDVGAGVTSWHLTDFGYPKTSTANIFVAEKSTSGASLFVGPASGTTLTAIELNTILYNNLSTSQIWRLPAISGTSVPYVKAVIGPAGGGVTFFPTDSEPFLWSGNSGTSNLALPPGNPFETVTLYGIKTGTSAYWLVEPKSSNWVTSN